MKCSIFRIIRNLRRDLFTSLAPMLFFVTLWLMLFGCLSRTTITGRYIAESSRDLSDVKVQFSLNDLDGNEYHYLVRLRSDGSFSFKVGQSGLYMLSTGIVEYSRAKWRSPSLSNDSNLYPIQIPKSGTMPIGKNYISDEIRILAPSDGQAISLSADFEFKWELIPMADYYSLHLYKWNDSGERYNIISIFSIRSPTIHLSDIKNLDSVEGEIDFNAILKRGTFLRKKQELIAGRYGLSIDAYSIVTEEERFVDVARSPAEWGLRLAE